MTNSSIRLSTLVTFAVSIQTPRTPMLQMSGRVSPSVKISSPFSVTGSFTAYFTDRIRIRRNRSSRIIGQIPGERPRVPMLISLLFSISGCNSQERMVWGALNDNALIFLCCLAKAGFAPIFEFGTFYGPEAYNPGFGDLTIPGTRAMNVRAESLASYERTVVTRQSCNQAMPCREIASGSFVAGVLAGKIAVIFVPKALESTVNSPWHWSTRSRIPLIPTPTPWD
jgi:hypothetical protein